MVKNKDSQKFLIFLQAWAKGINNLIAIFIVKLTLKTVIDNYLY